MSDKRKWEDYLTSILQAAENLRHHEPENDELEQVKQIDDEIWAILWYIDDGRPE